MSEEFAAAVVEEAKRRLGDDLAATIRNMPDSADVMWEAGHPTAYERWLFAKAKEMIAELTEESP